MRGLVEHERLRVGERREDEDVGGGVVRAELAAVALAVFLRKHAPPEPARLLPSADAFAYVNLKWIRTFNATGQLPPISREPEYQKFVDETGFQFERDLDQAAVPPASKQANYLIRTVGFIHGFEHFIGVGKRPVLEICAER